jgi:tetratricopeptide (TPR) repeat protein/LysM repeat protein
MIPPRPLQPRYAIKAKSKLKDKVLIFLAALLISIPTLLHGQEGEQEEVSTKIVSYIIIKGDKLKNVAVRFQVPIKTLKKLNKISSKNFTVYPGLTLQVPVKTRPKVWDPTKEDISDNGLLSQDRRPSVDYEIIDDGFDYDMKDDFITTSDAMDDSLQFEHVGLHMGKIDKRISLLSYRIDSFKQVEFNFQYNETDINSVLGRMKIARDKYYINGPMGREIDSLKRVKAKLADLRIRLRSRITEYEYLMDNVAYAKDNYEKDERNKDTHWGDQITYESNYARSKAKHDEKLVDLSPKAHTDTIKTQPKAIRIDAVAPAPKPVVKVDTIVPAPKSVAVVKDTLTPSVKPVVVVKDTIVPAPKPVAVIKDTLEKTLPAAPKSSPFGLHQRVDIATLSAKNTWIEIKHTGKRELELLPSLPIDKGTVDKTILAPPVTKEFNTAPSVIKTDSALKMAPVVKHNQDTLHKTPATVAKKDTISKPKAAIIAIDTTHKIVPKTLVKDTLAKPAKSAPTNTTDTVVGATRVKDALFNPARITTPVRAVDTMPNGKPAQAVKDTAENLESLKAMAKTPDNNKSAVKSIPATTDTSGEDEVSRATRERIAKAKKEPAAKAEPAKTTKKEPEVKSPITKKPDDIDKQAPIVKIDSSKLKRDQMPLATIVASSKELPSTSGPLLPLDMKYDSSMLYREKKINQDPLASYKTDSNFVITSVQLKEIPIVEIKNKPKYLIPVDSISRIKGEFYLIRARQVLEKGDFKEGDKYLRKSLELNPNNASTWMLHADLCLTTGAADKALKEYVISGEIDSSNPKVFYNIALLFAKANDEQKAYKYFSKATDVNDKYLLAYMGRASVLMDTRDYEGAILDYDKTLSINKYYSPAYKGRALAKMEARRFEDAVNDFNQYLEIEDPDGYVLYQRGIAKILSNNLLQGCLDLSSSLELGFKDAEKAIKKFCE